MLIDHRIVTILIIGLTLSGCSASDDERTTDLSGGGSIEWVDPESLQPGPIRHAELTVAQINRIRKLQSIFFEVDGQSLDQWIDNFRRDANPDRELAIWERMAAAYSAYCSENDLTQSEKLDVYKVVLLRSMAPPDDVLSNVELNAITKDDAVEVMNGYVD